MEGLRVKLVRDKMQPLDDGETMTPANSKAGRVMALLLKLYEEIGEIQDKPHDPEEYADVLEALLELARLNGVPWAQVEERLLAKRQTRGGFRRGLVLQRPV